MVAGKCRLGGWLSVSAMIYILIILASVVWAALALFSPWFNHLNKENEPVKRTTHRRTLP